MHTLTIQSQMKEWIETRLGVDAMHRHERGLRDHEEHTELAQVCGVTQEEAHRIVDTVYAKDVGNIVQELGGAILTLAAVAESYKLDLGMCAQLELTRIHTLPPEKFQKRQAKNIVDGIGR